MLAGAAWRTAMISDDVQRIRLDAKERSLEEFRNRCQELHDENNRLIAANETQEHDSQLVLKFLREDAERKDELIESLRKTINQQRELFAAQREDERQAAAAELGSVKEELTTQIDNLTRSLENARDELARLQEFKEQKQNIERALEEGEQERDRMRDDHKLAMETLERKFLEEKNRLQKECALQPCPRDVAEARAPPHGARASPRVFPTPLLRPRPARPHDSHCATARRDRRRYKLMLAEMKKSSQEEAVERLDSSTKKILFENRRMAEELRLQVSETDELQKGKKTLEEEAKKLRREVSLNEQAVKEYAKQGFRQSKEIKDLTAKVKGLERSLAHSIAIFEKERETLQQADQRKLAEAEPDSQGLRQLVKLKSKELSHMKRLAAVILQKRNEVCPPSPPSPHLRPTPTSAVRGCRLPPHHHSPPHRCPAPRAPRPVSRAPRPAPHHVAGCAHRSRRFCSTRSSW